MKSYQETEINACGRKFRILVWDRARKPFEAQVWGESGVAWKQLACFRTRTEAIKVCSRLAIAWLEGGYADEMRRIEYDLAAARDGHCAELEQLESDEASEIAGLANMQGDYGQ